MKKSIIRIAVFSLLVAALAVPSGRAFGQEKKDKVGKEKTGKTEQGEKAAKKQAAFPFRGKVGAVDKTAKTITVGERTFQITSETRIIKAGNPATLDDVAVGEEIRGNCHKTVDGKFVARLVRVGPRPEAAEAGKEAVKKEGELKKEGVKKGEKAKKENTAQ